MNQFGYYEFVGFSASAVQPDDLSMLSLDPDTSALLIDFDGTFTDIVDTPGAVHVSAQDSQLLTRLSRRFGDAVAIVSGRNLDDLSRRLHGFEGTIAGGHGSEMRHDGNTLNNAVCDEVRLEHIKKAAFELGIVEPRIIVEEKSFGVTMHYRQHPDMEPKVRNFLDCLIGDDPDFAVLQAKMALEVKPRTVSKALAIEHILRSPRFAERTIVYAGDDETDETAFAYVNEHDGITIKVGEGPTGARYHVESPKAFKDWLRRQLGQ